MKFVSAPRAHPIGTTYLLILAVCLFVWPVVLGIPSMTLRFVWLALAFCLLCVSSYCLERSLMNAPSLQLRFGRTPLFLVLLTCLALSVSLFTVPIHAFSDEATIAIPAFTVLAHLAKITGWLVLEIGVTVGLLLLFLSTRLLRLWQAMLIVLIMAIGAGFLARLSPDTTILATRFPPIVHLFNAIAFTVGQGHLTFLRGANLLWTILLGLTVWQCTPEWNDRSRTVAFLGVILGPMGWIYHTSLYQACGEITLGMSAVLLLTNILDDPRKKHLAAYVGIVFSVWMLYRPTAIIALLVSLVLLWVAGRKHAAKIIASVSLPIAAIWLALYPTYHYSFLLSSSQGKIFPAADMHQPLLPLLVAFRALPDNFGAPTLWLLGVSSLVVFLQGSKAFRIALTAAWLIALPTSAVQQLIQLPVYWGYPRFNILLLLPLAIGLAGLVSLPSLTKRAQSLLAVAILIALAAGTPFQTVPFAQNLRNGINNVYQTTTGGDSPLPATLITEQTLQKYPNAVFILPDSTYFDLFIASGLLTVEQRSKLLERGRAWTLSSTDRPVVIQAPVLTTYMPNISAEYESRLRAARTWALTQKNHEIIRLGIEEAVIVY